MTVNRPELVGLSVLVLTLTTTVSLTQNTGNPLLSGNTVSPVLSGNTVVQGHEAPPPWSVADRDGWTLGRRRSVNACPLKLLGKNLQHTQQAKVRLSA